MDCNMPGFPVLHYLPEFVQIHVHWVNDANNHLILCHSFLLLSTIFPSIRVFSIESALRIRWPKYWSFSFSMSPSNEYSGLISFRIHWFDILAAHRILKSLLQHHSLKASVLQHSAFFMVQLLYPYMTSGKTNALTIWTSLNRLWGWLQTESGGLVLLPTRLTGFPEENDRREGEAATALTAWLPATAGSLLAVVLYSLASSKVL